MKYVDIVAMRKKVDWFSFTWKSVVPEVVSSNSAIVQALATHFLKRSLIFNEFGFQEVVRVKQFDRISDQGFVVYLSITTIDESIPDTFDSYVVDWITAAFICNHRADGFIDVQVKLILSKDVILKRKQNIQGWEDSTYRCGYTCEPGDPEQNTFYLAFRCDLYDKRPGMTADEIESPYYRCFELFEWYVMLHAHPSGKLVRKKFEYE